MENTEKQSIYFNLKFCEKDNELHKIRFLQRLGGLKVGNVPPPGENLNTSYFNMYVDI